MLAEPTFNGLRISLSDKDRFIYNEGKPDLFSDVIKGAQLNNELIDLDVKTNFRLKCDNWWVVEWKILTCRSYI